MAEFIQVDIASLGRLLLWVDWHADNYVSTMSDSVRGSGRMSHKMTLWKAVDLLALLCHLFPSLSLPIVPTDRDNARDGRFLQNEEIYITLVCFYVTLSPSLYCVS